MGELPKRFYGVRNREGIKPGCPWRFSSGPKNLLMLRCAVLVVLRLPPDGIWLQVHAVEPRLVMAVPDSAPQPPSTAALYGSPQLSSTTAPQLALQVPATHEHTPQPHAQLQGTPRHPNASNGSTLHASTCASLPTPTGLAKSHPPCCQHLDGAESLKKQHAPPIKPVV